jgi:hypothetical protein
VRYESLEVTQEMMQSESAATQPLCRKSHYNLRRVSGRNEVEFTVCEDEEDPLKQEVEEDKIIISIKEVDNSGSVVCSKTMEGDKVPSLPAGAVTVIHNDSQKK